MALRQRKSTSGVPRIPDSFGDLQVNSCRNPACSNFAISARPFVARGRPPSGSPRKSDDYILTGNNKAAPDSISEMRSLQSYAFDKEQRCDCRGTDTDLGLSRAAARARMSSCVVR
jgi:hypothetical protein